MKSRIQITVPVEPSLREFLLDLAKKQDRTLAATARRILLEAARRAEKQPPAAA